MFFISLAVCVQLQVVELAWGKGALVFRGGIVQPRLELPTQALPKRGAEFLCLEQLDGGEPGRIAKLYAASGLCVHSIHAIRSIRMTTANAMADRRNQVVIRRCIEGIQIALR